MRHRPFGASSLAVSELGLGCSRLGSLLGASKSAAKKLLGEALNRGITYFDTSDIYGQGDSERLIGEGVAGRRGVVIASKIGKRHPLKFRLVSSLKAPLAPMLQRLGQGSVKAARSKAVPTHFEKSYLAKALDRSLKRLRVETIDVVMLHSPSTEILRCGDAIGALEAGRAAGKIGVIGASVDDLSAGLAALADPRIRALQIPLHYGQSEFHTLVKEAAASGVAVVAREIFGGVGSPALNCVSVEAAVRAALALPGISVALVGTTRSEHLFEAVDAVPQ